MNKKNILFRFDFSREKDLSYGHYFRSKKIINLIKNKFNIFFLIKKYENNLIFKKLKKKNLIQKNTSLYINNHLIKKKFDYCFVDLPYKDKELFLLRNTIKYFLVIDDKFKNFKISDYYFFNRGLSKNFFNIQKKKIFTGPKYFFLDKNKFKKKPKKKIVNILVNFGGSDPLNFSKKFLKKILDKRFMSFNFFLILGPGNNEKLNSKNFQNIYLYKNISNKKLQKLRERCDLAISSGGNFLVENIFVGLPTLSISTSYHEKNFINELQENHKVTKKINIKDIKKLLFKNFHDIDVDKIYINCLKLKKKNIFQSTIKSLL